MGLGFRRDLCIPRCGVDRLGGDDDVKLLTHLGDVCCKHMSCLLPPRTKPIPAASRTVHHRPVKSISEAILILKKHGYNSSMSESLQGLSLDLTLLLVTASLTSNRPSRLAFSTE